MMPSDRLEVVHDLEKFPLHLCFCDRVRFPVFRILLIFEHIDTRMSDEWEFFMELFYSFQCFSWKRVGKPEDEVYVDRMSLFSSFRSVAEKSLFHSLKRF